MRLLLLVVGDSRPPSHTSVLKDEAAGVREVPIIQMGKMRLERYHHSQSSAD